MGLENVPLMFPSPNGYCVQKRLAASDIKTHRPPLNFSKKLKPLRIWTGKYFSFTFLGQKAGTTRKKSSQK
jgi:hypothetical protein